LKFLTGKIIGYSDFDLNKLILIVHWVFWNTCLVDFGYMIWKKRLVMRNFGFKMIFTLKILKPEILVIVPKCLV
jgi:hypothetical protein